MKIFILVGLIVSFNLKASINNEDGGIPDPMACTLDINPWGHPSNCDCGPNYVWNEVMGRCDLKREFPCTRDINEWGHPSHCGCYEGYSYDSREGICKPQMPEAP
jgi:hypothetical protein